VHPPWQNPRYAPGRRYFLVQIISTCETTTILSHL
jgi:hypothetical protein